MAIAAALLVLAASPAGAQFKPLSGHEYRETIDPKHNVSGHLVVGVSLVDAQRTARLEDLQVTGRTISVFVNRDLAVGEHIRVDLDSPDGRFHGTGVWQVDEKIEQSGWRELKLLPAGEPLKRPRLQGGSLAVSVRVVEPGRQSSPRLLLASLTPVAELEKQGQQAELWLQINARRAQMAVRGSGSKPLPCERVATASAVRFDTLCRIPVAQLEVKANRYQLTLLRRDGFAVQPHPIEVSM